MEKKRRRGSVYNNLADNEYIANNLEETKIMPSYVEATKVFSEATIVVPKIENTLENIEYDEYSYIQEENYDTSILSEDDNLYLEDNMDYEDYEDYEYDKAENAIYTGTFIINLVLSIVGLILIFVVIAVILNMYAWLKTDIQNILRYIGF